MNARVVLVVEQEHVLDREHILSIEELTHGIVATEAEQADRELRHDLGHGGQVGHGGLGHGGHEGTGGTGALEQRKNDGMERRRRQSKRKEVVGGGLGMDSTADKGAGRKRVHFERLNLKHHFGCVDKSCSHNVVLESCVLSKDVDVEDCYASCVLSSSLSGNDAPGAFAKDIHRVERSKALPNAPNDPTG